MVGTVIAMAAADEVLWRGFVTRLIAERVGSRTAWLYAIVPYALAQVPTMWALARSRGRAESVLPIARHRRRLRVGRARPAAARTTRPRHRVARALQLVRADDVSLWGAAERLQPRSMAVNVRILAPRPIAGGDVEESRRRLLLSVTSARSISPCSSTARIRRSARCSCAWPEDVLTVARSGLGPRDPRTYRRRALATIGDLSDTDAVRANLRRFATREKMRIAARELLPGVGSDVDVTARELSDLADVCLDIALREACCGPRRASASRRTRSGGRCAFVVIGMGKLGGRELNAGSDVDLISSTRPTKASSKKTAQPTDLTLHEYFTRVAQRITATLEEPPRTASSGGSICASVPRARAEPLVNALAAAERYYETWGRTWERAALVRARPVAGDLRVRRAGARGARAVHLAARREPEDRRRDARPPRARARRAQRRSGARSQARSGRHSRGRVLRPVAPADLGRARAEGAEHEHPRRAPPSARRGLVTDREATEVSRRVPRAPPPRAPHPVRDRPADAHAARRATLSSVESRDRSASRASAQLEADLDKTRASAWPRASRRSPPERARERREPASLETSLLALDAADESAVLAWLPTRFGTTRLARSRAPSPRARAPPRLLRSAPPTRDQYPELAPLLVEALSDAADPEQATRLMAAFFARLSRRASTCARSPTIRGRRAGSRGSSARARSSASRGRASRARRSPALRHAARRPGERARSGRRRGRGAAAGVGRDADEFVGALRRAKRRVTMEVGPRRSRRRARHARVHLGARARSPTPRSITPRASPCAKKGEPRSEGSRSSPWASSAAARSATAPTSISSSSTTTRGERERSGALHSRRPSASSVCSARRTATAPATSSIRASVPRETKGFSSFRSTPSRATKSRARRPDWERQALVKARFCAGDAELGSGWKRSRTPRPTSAALRRRRSVHHLRIADGEGARRRADRRLGTRALRPQGRTRRSRRRRVRNPMAADEIRAGSARAHAPTPKPPRRARDLRVPRSAPRGALFATATAFFVSSSSACACIHGTSAQLIEEGAPGLAILARRVGMRDGPRGSASEALLSHYVAVTTEVRAAYLAVLGEKPNPG